MHEIKLDGYRMAARIEPIAAPMVAGLSLGLKLLGDLLQKLGPSLLLDRSGQAHQNAHLLVVQLQRHGRLRGVGSPLMTACARRPQGASEQRHKRLNGR
jgi:hypothetical protein